MFLGMEIINLEFVCVFDGVGVKNIYNIVYRYLQNNFDNNCDCKFNV